MATPAAVLSILIEAHTGKAATSLRGMQTQLRETGAHITTVEQGSTRMGRSAEEGSRRASRSFGSLAKSVALAGGAFAAFEAAKEAIHSTLELSHATERLSAVTGLGVKQSSQWIEVFKVRNVQARQVTQSFITLAKSVKAAEDADKQHGGAITALVEKQKQQRAALVATGASQAKLTALQKSQGAALDGLRGKSDKASAAFKELGVSQAVLKSGDLNQVLLSVADGLSKVDNPARRAALSQQLFGRASQGLLPILSEGRKGVEDALAATQRYGAFLPNNVKQLRQAREAQFAMNLAMDGMKISFTTAVLPMLIQGAQKLMTFITQMRTGKGAGGEFASAISAAFGVVKNVVGTVVGAVGGLGNALTIALAAFAVSKIAAFAGALKDLFLIIKANPIGAFFTAVGLLVTVLGSILGPQKSAAESARQLAEAWNKASDAARGLRDAELNVKQTKLDLIRATTAEKDAHDAATAAVAKYGPRSQQAKDADLNWRQAKLDLRRATNAHRDAITDSGRAASANIQITAKAVSGTLDAIGTDRRRVKSLRDLITFMQDNGAKTDVVRGKQEELRAAVKLLNHDQATLNQQLHAMPSDVRTRVMVNVDFVSNMAGAITSIGNSIGVALGSAPKHYTGGLVTQPGYFAGEEAPRHPEVILATNPKYRQRNLGLFAQAGQMLGVPGFATGGVASAGPMVGGIDPWTGQHADAWMKARASAWVKPIAQKAMAAGAGAVPSGAGVVGDPSGKPVAAWIEKILQWARGHGWTGTVTSGFRSYAQQAAIYNSGVRPAALPGTSNHEGAQYPRGAVDVSNAAQLSAILQGSPYASTLVWAGAKDPVHFSHPHGGSYKIGGIFGKAVRSIPRFATGGVWRVRASQEAASSGSGWTELSPNGNAAARLGIARTFSNNPAHYPDFASLGKMFPRGTMATLKSEQTGRSASAPLTDVGDGSSFAPAVGITPALAGRLGGFPSTVLISMANAFRPFPGMGTLVSGSGGTGGGVKVTGSTSGAAPTPHYPTGAVIAPPAIGFAHGHKQPFGAYGQRLGELLKWSKTWQARLLGMPAGPTLGGRTPDTVAGAASLAGRIGANKTSIDRLGGQADTLTSFYGWDSLQLLDANGNRDEKQIKLAVSEIDRVLKLREQIFNRWQMIVALTQRLVAANRLIVGRLQKGLRSISLKGLKGARLTAARERIKNTRDQIAVYQGNAATALSDLAGSSDSRDKAWLDLDTLRKTRATITGTVAQPVNTTVDTSDSVALLQTLLQQANQRTSVSEAQIGVFRNLQSFPYLGGYASGGLLPGAGWAMVGEQGPELAHLPGGTRVYSNSDTGQMAGANVRVVMEDHRTRVFVNDVEQIVDQRLRQQTRAGGRPLPGRGGGRTGV